MINKKIFYILHKEVIIVMAIFFFNIGYSQTYNTKIRAAINIEENSEFFTFSPTAENLTNTGFSLRYEFMLFKTDNNNNTNKNTQSNRFVLKPNEKQILSKVSVNRSEEGKVILVLVLYDLEDKPIGQDRIVLKFKDDQLQIEKEKITPKKIAKTDQAKPQDGFIIEGLLIENTKTKAGRDFYKYFYSEYTNKNIKSSKNILIDEVLAGFGGRSSKISVKVDNQLVWQFFTQPKKEFLKKMASIAIGRSIAKLQQIEQQKNNFIQY